MEQAGRAFRVLVVDDDPEICDVLEQGLVRAGLTVLCAANLARARELLATERVDVAVVDMVLRGGFGEPVAELARELGVPVVLMSGHPAKIESHDPRHPFLEKPFRIDALHALIRRTLGALPG
jgi:DNA-binding NtrC family response regulator